MQTLLNPSVHIEVRNGSCNSYLPSTTGLERLLWTMRYLVANGLYVAVSLMCYQHTHEMLSAQSQHDVQPLCAGRAPCMCCIHLVVLII